MRKLLRSYRRQPDACPVSAAAAIKVPNFYPRSLAAALPQPFSTKEKLPHLPTREPFQLLLSGITYSSGRSITLSVKYAPVGSSCEPLRTLSAEPSSVKVSLKSPFILTASSIESNSTTA